MGMFGFISAVLLIIGTISVFIWNIINPPVSRFVIAVYMVVTFLMALHNAITEWKDKGRIY